MSVPSGGWFGRFKMNVSIVGAIEHIRSAMDAMVSGSQRLLGHAPSTKSKYKMASFRQRAEKKRVKVLSVSLYLMFVMSSAIVMCIYYALFWRPCTSKIFFHNDVTSPENNRCCAYSESWMACFWPGAKCHVEKGRSVCPTSGDLDPVTRPGDLIPVIDPGREVRAACGTDK
ncbi:uncharacterized protein LOC128243164 isoform X2 [Mya arenaria]|uniref:uncharacterized protein LOC128243164 isoform X2 n=1 Tax=Mya arenaria TaxID=6604 RepID=UPI0022E06A75|nr:uncharacterized protein LOC128243164 isoform X2 [Mya arenaria]XP_052816710.1 uncharacterized protein LOC128243164 isoform X2 [Mya arenaria]